MDDERLSIERDFCDALQRDHRVVVAAVRTRCFVHALAAASKSVRNRAIPGQKFAHLLHLAYMFSMPMFYDEVVTAAAELDDVEYTQLDVLCRVAVCLKRGRMAYDQDPTVDDVEALLEEWYLAPAPAPA